MDTGNFKKLFLEVHVKVLLCSDAIACIAIGSLQHVPAFCRHVSLPFTFVPGGFPPLAPEVEEGLCQVLAHLWLQSQMGSLTAKPAAPGSPEAYQAKFVEFCMHQIAMDQSPVYGDGFRTAYTATVQQGLLQTLETVRRTGRLPA